MTISFMFALSCTYNKIPFISPDSYEAEYISWNINVSKEWIKCEDDYFLWRYPWEDRDIIKSVSAEFEIPIKYLYRLHYIESKMNPNAIRYENNGSRSIGYSQLNDSNAEYFADRFNNGAPIDFYDKEQNIRIGAAYLKYLYNRLDQDWLLVFAAYQWGLGNVLSSTEFPNIVLDYMYTIYHGSSYIKNVQVITKGVLGII
jgi:hypothetical protein